MAAGGRALGRVRTRLALAGAVVALRRGVLPSSAGAVASILDNRPASRTSTQRADRRRRPPRSAAPSTGPGRPCELEPLRHPGVADQRRRLPRLAARPATRPRRARAGSAPTAPSSSSPPPTSSALDLVNDSPLVGSDGHAVLFRQRFGGLTAGHDGMITVGVTARASSTSAPRPPAARPRPPRRRSRRPRRGCAPPPTRACSVARDAISRRHEQARRLDDVRRRRA